MTARGEATRARLLDATRRVVRDIGYAHASTRAIAHAAGVTEATIYRHFPDKRALLVGAVLDGDAHVLDRLADLPGRVGQATVAGNLTWALLKLAELREDLLPLELALLTDPQVQQPAGALLAGVADADSVTGPPALLVAYLSAERDLGRVRADLDPAHAAVVLLVLLFGLCLRPQPEQQRAAAIEAAVRVVVLGLRGEHVPA